MGVYETSDAEIRQKLNHRILKKYVNDSTLVIEELGLDHGRNRIDIAVLNSSIHGYEIKSSRDTLHRIPEQLLAYTAALEKLTLVVAPKHVEDLSYLLPPWCGLMVVDKGKRGGLRFYSIRRALRNPNVDLFRMAHLLWKNEAEYLLTKHNVHYRQNRITRTQLYRLIAEHITLIDLKQYIKVCFVSRESWRAH